MTLTDPHRATVREKLPPVIADDAALDALMSQFPASPADRPVTESILDAKLDVKLAALEVRLTDKIGAVQMRIFAIVLPFIVALNATMVVIVANLRP